MVACSLLSNEESCSAPHPHGSVTANYIVIGVGVGTSLDNKIKPPIPIGWLSAGSNPVKTQSNLHSIVAKNQGARVFQVRFSYRINALVTHSHDLHKFFLSFGIDERY